MLAVSFSGGGDLPRSRQSLQAGETAPGELPTNICFWAEEISANRGKKINHLRTAEEQGFWTSSPMAGTRISSQMVQVVAPTPFNCNVVIFRNSLRRKIVSVWC